MLKKILISIILIIVLYDLYSTWNISKPMLTKHYEEIYNKVDHNEKDNSEDYDEDHDEDNSEDHDEKNHYTEDHDEKNHYTEYPNRESIVHPNRESIVHSNRESIVHPNRELIVHPNRELIVHPNRESIVHHSDSNIDINEYGKPYDYKENEFIHWEFYEPMPWTKIIYIYNKEYPYHYHIKARIPSLNDYQSWKKIITNLEFNPKNGELIIPCKDEASALSIANLLISNFKGDITLDEIVSKDLIGVSILKSRKYEVVKKKIKEQIIENIINKQTSFNDLNKDIEIKHPVKNKKNTTLNDININNNNYFFYEDTNNNKVDLNPYDGSEFSFI